MIFPPTLLLTASLLLPSSQAPASEGDIGAQVQAGIDRALAAESQDQQQEAFDAIVALGCPAVPSIADRMDDRRKLPVRDLKLRNDFPGAFEAFRQYNPEVVTDALAAILNDITSWDCGFIFNGATEAERARTVKCWQDFVHETPVKNCGRK